jgi:arylsulfatase A-like enzyme
MSHKPCFGAFQWIIIALGSGVAAALIEVLVRFSRAREALSLDQLAIAVSANVAVVGFLAAAAVGVACLVVGALARMFARHRHDAHPAVAGALVAVLAITVVLATDLFGLRSGYPMALSFCALSGGATAAAVVVWPKRIPNRMIRGPIAAATVVTWLASAVAGTAAYARTSSRIDAWVQAPSPSTQPARPDKPNIIVVVLDTLRADRVGVYSGGDLTPNLDRLAASSIVYTHAISTAPWTLPSHASLFTGLYPSDHGVNWGHFGLDDRFDTLAELLRNAAYDTFAVSNNPMLNDQDGYGQGFDAFLETSEDPSLSQWRLAMDCRTVAGLARGLGLPPVVAEDAGSGWTNWLLERRLKRQTEARRPFFAFLNYFEAHDPYYPPAALRKSRLDPAERASYAGFVQRREDLISHACGNAENAFTPEQIQLMSALYDAEVAYQDQVVGHMLEIFRRTGTLDDAWLVVLSDHGELFGEAGMVFHTAGAHYKLLHVPLIVRPPGGVEARRVDTPVQPVDVFATLVEQAGAAMPSAVRAAYPLPLNSAEAGQREICVAQTFGASLYSLTIAQLRSRRTDFSHWMTWLTSVVADGYLLELDADRPVSLFELKEHVQADENLLETRSQVLHALIEKYERWSTAPAAGAQP